MEEGQTTQWPKEKGQNDKQRSTKHTHKAKDNGRVSSSCSTSGTCRVYLFTNPVISHVADKANLFAPTYPVEIICCCPPLSHISPISILIYDHNPPSVKTVGCSLFRAQVSTFVYSLITGRIVGYITFICVWEWIIGRDAKYIVAISFIGRIRQTCSPLPTQWR
jgi:hypothetical protein